MNFNRNKKSGIKGLWAFLAGLIIAFVIVMPTAAAGNELHSITTTVDINSDGSANVTEVWDITVTEGTEIYKEMKSMDSSPIHDFEVMSNDLVFEAQDEWNVDGDIDDKAFKSGVIQDGDDYELCFGVGDYGRHTFTMYYTIEDFVQEYSDMYGMNFQLIGSSMSIMPEKMSVIISGHGISADTLVYGFGFEGNINVENQGESYYINANNENGDGDHGTVDYVNILAGFDGASYSSSNTKHSDRTFEDIADEAKEGSDYNDDIGLKDALIIVAVIAGFTLIFILLIVSHYRRKKYGYEYTVKFTDGTDYKSLPKKTEVDYFRDIPANKDMFMFSYIAEQAILVDKSQREEGLFAAVLLNWIRNKNIEFVMLEAQGSIIKKDSHRMHFIDDSTLKTSMEKELYSYLKSAAGDDGILEDKEFASWCKKNYSQMLYWFKNVNIKVKAMLKTDGYADAADNKGMYNGRKGYGTNHIIYTDKFKEALLQSVGFKRFIQEFSSMGEKSVKEVVLWEEYLIFSSILGLADKVEKEIGRLYPEFTAHSDLDPTFTVLSARAFAISSMHEARAASDRASGGGGSSSTGGGGSSFSGGGGGGVR